MDHKNLNRADDRWSNLREATASQNQANILKKSSNTSGAKGVCWRKDSRKWQAQICINGKRRYLGSFDTREAAAAYAAAAKEHFGNLRGHLPAKARLEAPDPARGSRWRATCLGNLPDRARRAIKHPPATPIGCSRACSANERGRRLSFRIAACRSPALGIERRCPGPPLAGLILAIARTVGHRGM
jgi:hypothetical protein